MARCLTNERLGKRVFYEAMVAEGVVVCAAQRSARLIPSMFMTTVCTSYILYAPEDFDVPYRISVYCGIGLAVVFYYKAKKKDKTFLRNYNIKLAC
jgi:carbon starvation protein CstA